MSENKTYLDDETVVTAGKRKRSELTLPALYYPVADAYTVSWIDTLGEKAFCTWLKLHTLVKRTDAAQEEFGNRKTVTYSIESLAKDIFKVSKVTFYKMLKPLWNHGLIDIVEWKRHNKIGQKAMNIIVYQYPQNDKTLETKPLKKVRDYDKDYKSNGKIYGQKGADLKRKQAKDNNRAKTLTVRGIKVSYKNVDLINRLKTLTVTVKKTKRLTVKKTKPNNNSNTLLNNSNTKLNNTNNYKRINDDDEKNIDSQFSAVIQKQNYKELSRYLISQEIGWETMQRMVVELHNANIQFSKKGVVQQLDFMFAKSQREKISDFVVYFVNGMISRAATYQAEENFEKDYLDYESKKQDFMNDRTLEEEEAAERRKNIFYNWLEE